MLKSFEQYWWQLDIGSVLKEFGFDYFTIDIYDVKWGWSLDFRVDIPFELIKNPYKKEVYVTKYEKILRDLKLKFEIGELERNIFYVGYSHPIHKHIKTIISNDLRKTILDIIKSIDENYYHKLAYHLDQDI